MRLIAVAPTADVTVAVGLAADMARIEVDYAPSLQEFGSLLYRNHGAVGLLWLPDHWMAGSTVRDLRVGDVRNPMLVALGKLPEHPDFRARAIADILTSGADDVQPWPIDSFEMTILVATAKPRFAHLARLPLPIRMAMDPARAAVQIAFILASGIVR